MLHKEVIQASDRAGFIVNALLNPYTMAAIRMYEGGFATREDIDKGMMLGTNHPMGPLALCDFVGLDVVLAVAEVLYEEFKDPFYAPPPLLRRMVEGGLAGPQDRPRVLRVLARSAAGCRRGMSSWWPERRLTLTAPAPSMARVIWSLRTMPEARQRATGARSAAPGGRSLAALGLLLGRRRRRPGQQQEGGGGLDREGLHRPGHPGDVHLDHAGAVAVLLGHLVDDAVHDLAVAAARLPEVEEDRLPLGEEGLEIVEAA